MSIIRKIINSKNVYQPVGPYSQAVLADRTLYISGCLGLDTDNKMASGGAAGQARKALENMGAILKEAGSSYQNVVKATIFLNNISDFPDVNAVYKEFFVQNPPARSTFQVGRLPMGAEVEIEAIALVGDVTTVPASKV